MTVVPAGDVVLETAGDASERSPAVPRPLRRLWRLKWGLVATLVLLLIVLVSLAAPWLAPYSPVEVDIQHRLGPPDPPAANLRQHHAHQR